jgi:hypothetical protein
MTRVGIAARDRGRFVRLLLAALAASALPAGANSAHEFGLGFATGLPQAEFRDNLDAAGFGVAGYYGYIIPGSPVRVGAHFGYLIYGHEEREEPFSTTIPDVFVDVETSNNIVLGHLLLRVTPTAGLLRPYGEGLLGLQHLFTETEIHSQGDDETIAESSNWSDTAFSYGLGGGLQVEAAAPGSIDNQGDGPRVRRLLVDAGVRYLYGGEADYLKKGSIHRSADGRVAYHLMTSRTDLLLICLGVSVELE